jgi:hypothetical protein
MTYNVSKKMAEKMAQINKHKIGEYKTINGGKIATCINHKGKCGAGIIKTKLGCTGSAISMECLPYEVLFRKKPEDLPFNYHSPHKDLGIKCTVTSGVRKKEPQLNVRGGIV